MNPDLDWGYRIGNRMMFRGILRRMKMVYDFEPVAEHPLHWWQQEGGLRIAAAWLPASDEGSVPVWAQGWIPKDGLLAYFLHDFAYRYGGLYFKEPGQKEWEFRPVDRADADMLLRVQAQVDPAGRLGPVRAWAVWLAVRCGGGSRFHEWKAGDEVPAWPEERSEPDFGD